MISSHNLPFVSFAAIASTRGRAMAAMRVPAGVERHGNKGGILERHIHFEDVIGRSKNHLLFVGHNHRLQHVDHLGDVGHAHPVGMTSEDIQIQRGENGIAQAVLLNQETRDCCPATARTSRPIRQQRAPLFFSGSYLSMIAECLLIRPSMSKVDLSIWRIQSRRNPPKRKTAASGTTV